MPAKLSVISTHPSAWFPFKTRKILMGHSEALKVIELGEPPLGNASDEICIRGMKKFRIGVVGFFPLDWL